VVQGVVALIDNARGCRSRRTMQQCVDLARIASHPTATGHSGMRRRRAGPQERDDVVRENPDLRTPRQELYLEIARVERALRDAVDDLREMLRAGMPDAQCALLANRCLALSTQMLSAVDLLGPGEVEDATRAAARGLADLAHRLSQQVREK
jgi:hypothetical protein